MREPRSPTAPQAQSWPSPKWCAPTWETTMLELSNWQVAYGQHLALQGVELSVGKGEVVVILGTNGAGKSSVLNWIAGLVPALSGSSLRFEGQQLLGKPAREIVEAGIALVPEGRGIFG